MWCLNVTELFIVLYYEYIRRKAFATKRKEEKQKFLQQIYDVIF